MRNISVAAGLGAAMLSFGAAALQSQAPSVRAWKILEEGAAEKSSRKRAQAIHALGLLYRDKRAERLAAKALGDERPPVRTAAATALGQIGQPTAIPALKAALRDEELTVVLAATDSLWRLRDPTAFEVYYAVLMRERKSSQGLVESQMKMLKDPGALAKIGFEQGIGFIPYAGVGLGVFKAVTRDDTSPIRAAAALKLAWDPDPKAGEALALSALDSKWIVRAAVADAISKRGDPKLLRSLLPLLSDENDTVRYNAAAAVVRLSGIKAK